MIENDNNNFVIQFNGDLKSKVDQIIDEAYQKGYDACKIENEKAISVILNNLYKDVYNYYHEYTNTFIAMNLKADAKSHREDKPNLSYYDEQFQKYKQYTDTIFDMIFTIINYYKDLKKREEKKNIRILKDLDKMSSEDLANMIRTIKTTGISPSTYEKACLNEAADRLDLMDEIFNNFIEYTIDAIIDHFPEKWADDKDNGGLVLNCTLKEIIDIMKTFKEDIWSNNNVS